MRKLILMTFLAVAILSCKKKEDDSLKVNDYPLAGAWVSDSSRTKYYYDDSLTLNKGQVYQYPDNYHLYTITDHDMTHEWYENGARTGGDNYPVGITVEGAIITKDGYGTLETIKVISISASKLVLLYQDDVNEHFTTKYYVYLSSL